MLGLDRYRYHEKPAGTHNAKLVFVHPVRSVGHVGHSGASGLRNVDALFFKHGRAWCSLDQRRVGTRYIEIVACIRWDLWVT
jgi:hypothetical protein